MSHQPGPDRHRWLISYADYMTLLCAFFIMLYSVKLLNEEQYQAVQEVLGGMFTTQALQILPQPEVSTTILDHNNGVMPLYQTVKQQLQVFIDSNELILEQEGEWIKIRLKTDTLFSTGGWEINDEMMDMIEQLAMVVRPIPNEINIEGHTDDVPISTKNIVSNWDLSALRAVAMVRAFELFGVAPQRMAAVGFAYHKPLFANDSDEHRLANRRVEILIKQGSINQPWAREEFVE
ncbi:Flagellar motor protein of OmpA/MotB domain [Oleispira antarctica RB-8]|uniref:Flagellar motor protein of OmpA/MotB domain n=1 Tax=Oleispira antarctica RB-8 TaxID=698738 RepID=R4YQA2_OLEAN|nr:Flagellar motor protein of OmpA/MotB domain [Oleispira antarctica RB-8]